MWLKYGFWRRTGVELCMTSLREVLCRFSLLRSMEDCDSRLLLREECCRLDWPLEYWEMRCMLLELLELLVGEFMALLRLLFW